MRNYLVTGAAGFLGAHFCRQVLEQDPEALVVGVDALLPTAYRPRLDACKPFAEADRFLFDPVPVQNQRDIANLIGDLNLDGVVNFAAETHVDRSIGNPSPFVEHNVVGTVKLLQAATHTWKKMGKDLSREVHFHQVSTDEVFGSGASRPGQVYRPSSPYAASKAAADQFVQAWATTYGLRATWHYGCNTFGPWQHPEKLLPLYLRKSLQGEPFPLYGSGCQVRQWLSVADHVAILYRWLSHPRGSFLDIGRWPGQIPEDRRGSFLAIDSRAPARTNREILSLLAALLREQGVVPATLLQVPDRPGHDDLYLFSGAWAGGAQPLGLLEAALEETVQHALGEGRSFLLQTPTPSPEALWTTS